MQMEFGNSYNAVSTFVSIVTRPNCFLALEWMVMGSLALFFLFESLIFTMKGVMGM